MIYDWVENGSAWRSFDVTWVKKCCLDWLWGSLTLLLVDLGSPKTHKTCTWIWPFIYWKMCHHDLVLRSQGQHFSLNWLLSAITSVLIDLGSSLWHKICTWTGLKINFENSDCDLVYRSHQPNFVNFSSNWPRKVKITQHVHLDITLESFENGSVWPSFEVTQANDVTGTGFWAQ